MATISENLEALKTAKASIKSAIEGKGQDLTDVPFTQYSEKITDIKTEPNLIAATFITNGTYNASDEGVDGYSSVEVNVPTPDVSYVWDLIDRLISGTGEQLDISMLISPNISTIRDYAFIGNEKASKTIFYANDLTIPSNITTIGENAFRYVKLTGKVTIPSTCTEVKKYAFTNCLISEAEIDGGIVSSANCYIFTNCNNLKKFIVGPNMTYTPAYLCYNSSYIEEIVIRSSNISWAQYVVYSSGTLVIKRIIFETAQPCNVQDKGFYKMQTASLLVPYEYYDVYFNSTNYQQYSNPMYGYGSFIVGVSLPSTQGTYNLVWYPTLDDLLAGTNPVTECVSEDRHYAIFTEMETTE